MEIVYLIHLDKPFVHSQHYIGWSEFLTARFNHHKNGTGCRFLKRVNEAGIDYKIVREWKNQDRDFERRLKNRKNSTKLCPVCNPDSWEKNANVQSQKRV